MNNKKFSKNVIAFHPGYYISEIIEDMKISNSEFAALLEISTETLIQLINGEISLTDSLAKKLSVLTGTSVEVWLNLQNTYDQSRK